MENNQMNPQQGQPMGQQFNQPQQGQPMGQQFAQPQQGQPMGQQFAQPQQGQPMGQQFNQSQQGQPMGQQFAQPRQMQPATPKAPMSMNNRLLFISISLITVAVILFTLSPIKNRYYDNSALGTFNSIFTSVFSLANFAFLVITLIIGALLFVPKWTKQFLDYTNSRLIILVTAGVAGILSLVHFIMILTHTIQANGLFGDSSKFYPNNSFLVAPEVFKLEFISLPIAIALAVTALFLALPLLKKPIKKDRFFTALIIISIVLVVALILIFIFFFLGKATINYKPVFEISK